MYCIIIIFMSVLFSCVFQPFKVSHFEKRLSKEIEFREDKVHPKHYVREDKDAFDDSLSKEQVSVPAFEQKPKNYQLLEGADATFVCKVNATPLPNVSSFQIFKDFLVSVLFIFDSFSFDFLLFL